MRKIDYKKVRTHPKAIHNSTHRRMLQYRVRAHPLPKETSYFSHLRDTARGINDPAFLEKNLFSVNQVISSYYIK